MKLQDIVVALPKEWAMQQTRRTHKRPMSVKEKRASLDPYKVGLMRLDDMGIKAERMSELSITEIGRASIERKPIMVLKMCVDWIVVPYSYDSFREFRGHGFVIRGKKVHKFSHSDHKNGTLDELMKAYEDNWDTSLDSLDAEGLFNAFQGRRTHKGKKKCGMGVTAQPTQCKTEDHSRPWKRGERVHLRAENKKKCEANMKEQAAFNTIRVSKVGLMYKSKTKAVSSKTVY